MHKQPAFGEPEIDPSEIQSIFLDHEGSDSGQLLLASLVDIARQTVDLVCQPLQRPL